MFAFQQCQSQPAGVTNGSPGVCTARDHRVSQQLDQAVGGLCSALPFHTSDSSDPGLAHMFSTRPFTHTPANKSSRRSGTAAPTCCESTAVPVPQCRGRGRSKGSNWPFGCRSVAAGFTSHPSPYAAAVLRQFVATLSVFVTSVWGIAVHLLCFLLCTSGLLWMCCVFFFLVFFWGWGGGGDVLRAQW